ncbi:MAG: IPExxxVDY family protein [Bacteroidales bacterium]|jgi:hypothetical protein|nr:IPExxxVDY family protein [Bacteroidales bacterium]
MKPKSVYKLSLSPEKLSFTLIGISSHENEYRLAWSLNNFLELKFTQTEPLMGTAGEFMRYIHQGTDEQTVWLISNRCDNAYLLNKYKNFDFLLKFERELDASELTQWLQKLKGVALVSAILQIPVDKTVLTKISVP